MAEAKSKSPPRTRPSPDYLLPNAVNHPPETVFGLDVILLRVIYSAGVSGRWLTKRSRNRQGLFCKSSGAIHRPAFQAAASFAMPWKRHPAWAERVRRNTINRFSVSLSGFSEPSAPFYSPVKTRPGKRVYSLATAQPPGILMETPSAIPRARFPKPSC